MNESVKIVYPSIFTSADEHSIKAQQNFIRLNKWILIFLVLSTVLVSSSSEDWVLWTSIISLTGATVLSTAMLFLKLEKGWYEGRAIAESIKTLCWKFMVGAKPFPISLNQKDAEERLIDNFKKVIGQRKGFFQVVGGDFARHEQLPPELAKVRSLDHDSRKSTYKTQRLEKQRKWYSDKTDENKKWRKISLIIIITSQVVAIGSLMVSMNIEVHNTIASICIAVSTSFMAWLQLKRYQELRQSYLITATELSLIKSKISHVQSDEDLADFVDDAENAISREHTLWLARRDSIDLFD